MGQVIQPTDSPQFSGVRRDLSGNCCSGGAIALADANSPIADFQNFIASDPSAFVDTDEDGNAVLHLLVENMHCANCIQSIEKTLRSAEGVKEARVNFSTRRLLVRWDQDKISAADLVKPVIDLGYPLTPYNAAMMQSASEEENKRLLKALGVAGFAAANVMLLSVSVWAGIFSEDMGPSTRDFMHWVSALIAMPAVAYSGQVFFKSAIGALKNGRLNMDVPISLAVILAVGMSLSETIQSGHYAYFDAAVTLLFFLLIGRYLDSQARSKARSAAERLLLMKAVAATVVEADGTHRSIPVDNVTPGTTVHVAVGDRFPVDGEILEGRTSVDNSLVTGESLPVDASVGNAVFAGTLNLSAPIKVKATNTGDNTLLGDIVRLMENAEQGRAKYVRIADRIAEYYAPAVHILSALTFAGWWLLGFDWQVALLQGVAVLIVTCPCALGLAVPVVQVVASGRLLHRGILVKAADGLERLAVVDTIVFDKTGTITEGRLDLINKADISESSLVLAAKMARSSRHPLAQAVVRAAGGVSGELAGVEEHPGLGLSVQTDAGEIRLGSRSWCSAEELDGAENAGPEMWLSEPGKAPVQFLFEDTMRPDAFETVEALKKLGMHVELLSGDRKNVAENVAREAGIDHWNAEMRPEQKVQHLEALKAQGRNVLMVGDGLNDAPALTAANVSLSPASAADVSQTAADFVFQGRSLSAVLETVEVARFSHRLVKQNFGLAFGYNAIAVPLAVLGFVTPLFAAIAMSASSLVVCANSMRLRKSRKGMNA
ncbi:cadmium-translocating P-type ATPase [Sneathiella sp. P13V-1]|uniref:cation-translocating P-type ATPase n=1 Tax=Sneathiella sp. P13V-1 TaxID=2697366 RepID=UPI00187B51A2|nr:cation-translocating P-type ATPase [Sneathiella sp. P13V-1]MBE7636669.1 cadmium-translocating P-type ATPase [Sneathiella sp. P13V-1]